MTSPDEKAKSILEGKPEEAKKNLSKPLVIPKTFEHSKSDQISDILKLYKNQIAAALPKHITPERLIQLATTVISTDSKLKRCTPSSIIGGLMQASILGLDITPQLGQAFLIPRKNNKLGVIEATFLIGYKGYIQLMRRSDEIRTVYAYAVREGDTFNYRLGLDPNIEHIPVEKRGDLTKVYAVIKFKDGGFQMEVLSKEEVMAAKDCSAAKDSEYSPWNNKETEESMWRKTAIRRIQNYAPLSADFFRSVASDEQVLNPEMFLSDKSGVDISKLPQAEEVTIDQKQIGDHKDLGENPEPEKKEKTHRKRGPKTSEKDNPSTEREEPKTEEPNKVSPSQNSTTQPGLFDQKA
jgi:recombination protein RecT